MQKKLLFLIFTLIVFQNTFAILPKEISSQDSINDGPYIFKEHKKYKVIWIENSVLKSDIITPENFSLIKLRFDLKCSYKDLNDVYSHKCDFDQSYLNVDSIAVITDIHGAYDFYLDLLKASGIIDNNLNWKFGKGHLVVLGDSFDRGDMVTEVLWHLFGLEKQAKKAGGMVHVILGNHGLMVLGNDLRYINDKYKECETITDLKYTDLFSANSVLGRWLRNNPVVLTIDDIIFVHAGLSIDVVNRGLKINRINRKFYSDIIGKDIERIYENDELLFLSEERGPLWYRGYFTEPSFNESRLDSILHFYDKQHIVVGHTTFNDIKSFYNNKLFGVDAGLMDGEPGEILFFKNGVFYKGLITGERIKL